MTDRHHLPVQREPCPGCRGDPAVGAQAFEADPLACEVMTTEHFHAGAGRQPPPQRLSITQGAERLGIGGGPSSIGSGPGHCVARRSRVGHAAGALNR